MAKQEKTVNFKDFGQETQLSILSLLIQNKAFGYKMKEIILPEYFDSKYTQWLCQCVLNYIHKYKTHPKFSDLEIIIKEEFPSTAIQQLYLNILQQVKDVSLENRTFIEDKTFSFCFSKHRLLKLEEEKAHLLMGEFEKAKTVAHQSYKIVSEIGKEIDLKKDIEQILQAESHNNVVGTLFPTFNANMKGGPGAGDLVIIVAQSNLGKSMLLAAQAKHAADQGKNVVYFSLETKGEQLAERVLSAMTDVPQHKLRDNPELIKSKIDALPANIKFIQFKSTQAKTSLLKEKLDDLKSLGFFADMIVVDGLNQVKLPKGVSFSNSNDKFEFLAEELRDLANDEEVPLYAAFQSNRGGFNNAGADEQNIGKAIEVFQVADVLIILTQTPEMYEQQRCYATALKNRLGRRNLMIECDYDPSRCKFVEIGEVLRSQIISNQEEKKVIKGLSTMRETLSKRPAKLQV